MNDREKENGMKKVCMVVVEHPFQDARVFRKEAKSLQKKGYQVTMIVPRKQGYLFGVDGTPYKKHYLNKVFTYEGIKIVTYHAESCKHHLSKVLKDASVWDQAFQNPLTQLALKENADVYHVHEYLSLFAGVGIKRKMLEHKGKKVKLIYDSHELTPDPLSERYPEATKKNLYEKLLLMLDEVDQIITVSDSIKQWYQSKKPTVPVEVIYNSPPLTDYTPANTKVTDRLTVCFEGNLSNRKGNWEKIKAISELCAKEMPFQFKILGGTRFNEHLEIPSHLVDVITFTGWVDYAHIHEHMKDVHIGWIDSDGLDASLNERYAMPNKFFSYLTNGVPVVVNESDDLAAFLEKYRCGTVIHKKQASAEDYRDAFLQLYNDSQMLNQLSENARRIMEVSFCWGRMEDRLLAVYRSLLNEEVK
ncbi:glycosyltransferase [Geomicrobium sp. JCM 19037]|uniref:glycosyltransferase n=1 Tax=Geomicrobium sp. JCM 19037 TaxID=1460634 RepID=UPI001EE67D7E|nr:glycosyltransferase [Geomicrobium sp. JCM 19037]